jgi:hypothetical protein
MLDERRHFMRSPCGDSGGCVTDTPIRCRAEAAAMKVDARSP